MGVERIAEMGARNVLITAETRSFGFFREERKRVRLRAIAPQVEPVSGVGAGDVLLAAFLAARTAERSLEDSLRAAVAAGAASTLEVGAGRFPAPRGVAAAERRRRPRARACVDLRRRLRRRHQRTRALLASSSEPADRHAGRFVEPSGPPGYSWRMEGLNLDQTQLERLVELDRKFSREGLTFDDVLLVPAESHVLPNDVSTATQLTRELRIEIPIVSAAMDTVTEAGLAIALAREGGIGIIHRNLPIDAQVAEVDKVKRSSPG
jgi:hypothetical protein